MRLFVGVEVDPVVKRYIGELATNLKVKLGHIKATWVSQDNYHITLMFIGEVEDKMRKSIEKQLSGIMLDRFDLTLDALGTFGNPPRVLWLGVKRNDNLIQLAKVVNTILGGDINRFHPHITLARLKSRVLPRFNEVLDGVNIKNITWNVDRFVLFQSRLTPKGPIYTPLKTYKLR